VAADAVLRAVVDWDGTLSGSAARIPPPAGRPRYRDGPVA
jgi:hypothetical protein